MSTDHPNEQLSIVVIDAGVSDPSPTRLLAERIAQQDVDFGTDLMPVATGGSLAPGREHSHAR